MYNIMVGNAEDFENPISAPTAYTYLTSWLTHMGYCDMAAIDVPKTGFISEEVVLANFFVDLSVLDYHLLCYHPSTVAASIMFLTRVTLHYFMTQPLQMTNAGPISTKSREILGLVREGGGGGGRPCMAFTIL